MTVTQVEHQRRRGPVATLGCCSSCVAGPRGTAGPPKCIRKLIPGPRSFTAWRRDAEVRSGGNPIRASKEALHGPKGNAPAHDNPLVAAGAVQSLQPHCNLRSSVLHGSLCHPRRLRVPPETQRVPETRGNGIK